MEEENKNKKERLNAQLDIILNIIGQENSAFLTISGLAIALIAVLSLKDSLVYFKPIESKVLMTIFLVLVIVSLGTYSLTLHKGKKKSVKIIEEILGKKIPIQLSSFERILAYVPVVLMFIFFACVAFIIYVLWRNNFC